MPELTIRLMGSRIRQLREERGLEAGQLAYKAGVNRATVYRIEEGERPNTSAIIVAAIASALNTTTDYLLGRTNDPSPLANPAGASAQAREYAREMLDIFMDLEQYAPHLLPLAVNTLSTQVELLKTAREADRQNHNTEAERPRELSR